MSTPSVSLDDTGHIMMSHRRRELLSTAESMLTERVPVPFNVSIWHLSSELVCNQVINKHFDLSNCFKEISLQNYRYIAHFETKPNANY